MVIKILLKSLDNFVGGVPDVEVDFDGFLACPESHSVSLLPSRHHGSVDCVTAVDEAPYHRHQLGGQRSAVY